VGASGSISMLAAFRCRAIRQVALKKPSAM
jgi:hypothetical protein